MRTRITFSHASNFQTQDQKLYIETDQRLKAGEMSFNQDSLTQEEDLAQIKDTSPSLFLSETRKQNCLEPIETDDSSLISEIISIDSSVLIELKYKCN